MNPILSSIVQGITEKVRPEHKQAFENAVKAGKLILFNEKTHAHMEMVKNPQSLSDPVKTVSAGVTGLAWLMYQQSKQTMKIEVMVMSAIVLMCEAFDFAERGMGLQITNEIVAQTVKTLTENLFAKLGITPEQLQQQIYKGHQEIIDHQSGQDAPQDSSAPKGLLSKAMRGGE